MNLKGQEYYYIRNAQNDIIALNNSRGTTVATYTYDSWGKLLSIKDENGTDITSNKDHVGYKNPYRYRGYRYDTETGLYYLNSRYYNSEWGRFVSSDEIVGETGTLLSCNMFAYCENNFINMADLNGCFAVAIFIPEIIEGIISVVTTIIAVAPIVLSQVNAIISTYGPHLTAAARSLSDKSSTSRNKDNIRSSNNKKSNNKKNNNKKSKRPVKKSKLTPKDLNKLKSEVLSGKDIKVQCKEDAVEFIRKKFPQFKEESAGFRSREGWHFDCHSIKESINPIDDINIYSKQLKFRIHITWD
ncbi:RHS repeat-associated core domain-containing protein [Clostridium botulinum]|nr:RHS repeat-associated core domain-containing protein [Clostridium botulinum]